MSDRRATAKEMKAASRKRPACNERTKINDKFGEVMSAKHLCDAAQLGMHSLAIIHRVRALGENPAYQVPLFATVLQRNPPQQEHIFQFLFCFVH